MPSFPFNFEAPGLTLNQKLALAATKACPVCCGSGSGSGEIVCCECVRFYPGGEEITHFREMDNLQATFFNDCMPSASHSGLTINMLKEPLGTAITCPPSFGPNCRSWSAFSAEPGNPEEFATGINCHDGLAFLVTTEFFYWVLNARLNCQPCVNATLGTKWVLQFAWVDMINGYRDVISVHEDQLYNATLVDALMVEMNVMSCDPFVLEGQITSNCYFDLPDFTQSPYQDDNYTGDGSGGYPVCCKTSYENTNPCYFFKNKFCYAYSRDTRCVGSTTYIYITEP